MAPDSLTLLHDHDHAHDHVEERGEQKVTVEDVGLQMSSAVYVGYSRNFAVAPGNFVAAILQDIANTGAIPSSFSRYQDDLFLQTEQLVITPAVMLAEGVGPFGVQIGVQGPVGAAGEGREHDDAEAHGERITRWPPPGDVRGPRQSR